MFAALAAAYLAKGRFIDPEKGVRRLEAQVEDLLPEGGEIREAIEQFCAAYWHVRRDLDAVAVLGDRLQERIAHLARTEPPGLDRKDTHG